MGLRKTGAVIGCLGLWWTWANGYFVWVVVAIAAYVVWMWLRIPLERAERRARMPGFREIDPPGKD